MSSPSPSSLGSSRWSATPEPTISVKNTSKTSKDKGKQKSTGQAKNEGVDLNWAYKPPPDAVLIEEDVDAGEFDWDRVNGDDDVELWLIRVPESVKPKYLENVQVDVPSSSKSTRIGTVKRKHATFDIWSIGETENDDDELPIGGEEIKNISCLLPKKGEKGKLYQAPKPFARHLVVSARAVVPSAIVPSESGPDPETGKYKSVPRQRYPVELLKHRFMPYGSVGNLVNEDVAAMDVDIEEVPSPKKQKVDNQKKGETAAKEKNAEDTKKSPVVETKKSKGKKRKGDADVTGTPAPKKIKKAKTTS